MTRWPARRNKRRAETGRHAAAWSSLSTPRATIFKASSGKGRSPESSAAAATILLDLLRHLLADAEPCGLSQTLDQILAKLSHASTPPSGDLQCRKALDLLAKLALGLAQIVPLLQIEPQIGAVSTELPEPQRHAGRDRLLSFSTS